MSTLNLMSAASADPTYMKYLRGALREAQNAIREQVTRILGDHVMHSPQERAYRCMEELAEVMQSLDCPEQDVHMIIQGVYQRPKDPDPLDECGGVTMTLLALIECLNGNMGDLIIKTYEKCEDPAKQEKMRTRQHEKLHPEGFIP